MTLRQAIKAAFLLAAVTLPWAACSEKEAPGNHKTASLRLSRDFKLADGDGSPTCQVKVDIKYFEGSDSAAIRMNARIADELFGLPGLGIKEAADSFANICGQDYIGGLAQFYAQDRDDPSRRQWYEYRHSISSDIAHGREGIVTYVADLTQYEGGAHDTSIRTVMNFDAATGRTIAAQDLFVPGYEKRLEALLLEKLEEGQTFMTTSCCPSYIELVNKHIPKMKPFVSSTGSPMYYAARIAKEKYPDAKVVFVGPCIAKRKEAQRDECVDYVMSFEELHSVLVGLDIEVENAKEYGMKFASVREAHGFAQNGGVMGAVLSYLKADADKVHGIQVSDLNKKNIGVLKAYATRGMAEGNFIEVMACEGGCISGPDIYNDTNAGRRQLNKELGKINKTYESSEE